MRNRRPLALGLAAAVALLVAAPAFAQSTDDTTLTAVVASSVGRTIAVVTPPVATVMLDDVAISVGTPATVTVAEALVRGANPWSVTLDMTAPLADTTDAENQIPEEKVTIGASTTPVCVLPSVTCAGLTLTQPDNSANDLGGTLTIYTVTGQSTGLLSQYTSTSTSTVDFTVDADDYEGPVATMTAPLTFTLVQ